MANNGGSLLVVVGAARSTEGTTIRVLVLAFHIENRRAEAASCRKRVDTLCPDRKYVNYDARTYHIVQKKKTCCGSNAYREYVRELNESVFELNEDEGLDTGDTIVTLICKECGHALEETS